jgi:hypothetical protein
MAFGHCDDRRLSYIDSIYPARATNNLSVVREERRERHDEIRPSSDLSPAHCQSRCAAVLETDPDIRPLVSGCSAEQPRHHDLDIHTFSAADEPKRIWRLSTDKEMVPS